MDLFHVSGFTTLKTIISKTTGKRFLRKLNINHFYKKVQHDKETFMSCKRHLFNINICFAFSKYYYNLFESRRNNITENVKTGSDNL